MLPFSVVVDEAWNGECSRYEVCLYPLPYTLYMGRGNACSWRTVIKQRTDVGFVVYTDISLVSYFLLLFLC